MMLRFLIAVAVILAPGLVTDFASAQGVPVRLPITADDGSPIMNHQIMPDRTVAAEKLPGAVVAANPTGDVTLVEFYDLNCPYCRRASADIDALIAADKKLRLVLVPFPVLGIPSIQAGRVEIAVSKAVPPEKFYQYHRKLYEGRGTIDGQRAVAAMEPFKLDQQKVVNVANDDSITEIMKAHVRFADKLGLKATPSYLIQDVAIQGHPGQKTIKGIVESVRKCGKAVC